MSDFTVHIDGTAVPARAGETVFEVASRASVVIPTLCHDPRLEPTGACRMCLVEVEGQGRLVPGCAYKVTPDMRVRTQGERIDRHRAVLLSLYLADHRLDDDGLPEARAHGNQLRTLVQQHDTMRLPPLDSPREERVDANPYIGFDADLCIVCGRCTRYCDEVEAVSAIQLAGRGVHTTVATALQQPLMDSSCELCGGCVATCPTGALFGKKAPIQIEPGEQTVRTTCNFCGVGCQLDMRVRDDRIVSIEAPQPGTTVNDGNLCVKGRFAYDFVNHPDRLTTPLIRGDDGDLHPATWDQALDRVAEGLTRIRREHGSDALGFVSSSRCTGEENYLMQKLARAAFGTNNCHQCAAT